MTVPARANPTARRSQVAVSISGPAPMARDVMGGSLGVSVVGNGGLPHATHPTELNHDVNSSEEDSATMPSPSPLPSDRRRSDSGPQSPSFKASAEPVQRRGVSTGLREKLGILNDLLRQKQAARQPVGQIRCD